MDLKNIYTVYCPYCGQEIHLHKSLHSLIGYEKICSNPKCGEEFVMDESLVKRKEDPEVDKPEEQEQPGQAEPDPTDNSVETVQEDQQPEPEEPVICQFSDFGEQLPVGCFTGRISLKNETNPYIHYIMDKELTIGRFAPVAGRNQLFIRTEDTTLLADHVLVTVKEVQGGSQVFVTQQNPEGSCMVDGKVLCSGQKEQVKAGSTLQIGSLVFRFGMNA